MTTFDGWDARFYGDAMALPQGSVSDDVLMHFRTKGSKNGVRRYQQADGTWTPLGLKERRAREGWGESRAEIKAAKKVARAEKRAAKAETAAAKKVARAEKKTAKAEIKLAKSSTQKVNSSKKHSSLSKLTDEELKKRIARVKMELEYKELTKSPALKAGEQIFKSVLNYMDKKGEREAKKAMTLVELTKAKVDLERAHANIVQSKEGTKKAKQERKKAKQDRKKAEAESAKAYHEKKANARNAKAEMLKAKKENRESTLLGSIIKTHKEARLARIEDSKSINRGTTFVRSLIEGQRQVDKNNSAKKLFSRKLKNTRVTWQPDRYENQHKNADDRAKQELLNKMAESKAKQEQHKKDAEYWKFRQAHPRAKT